MQWTLRGMQPPLHGGNVQGTPRPQGKPSPPPLLSPIRAASLAPGSRETLEKAVRALALQPCEHRTVNLEKQNAGGARRALGVALDARSCLSTSALLLCVPGKSLGVSEPHFVHLLNTNANTGI